MREAMTEFELESARRSRGRRRGLSGLGILLVIVGLLALAVTYVTVPPWVFRLWPAVLIAVGLFGLLRRPGWVEELDLQFGTQVSRTLDRPRRLFSLFLVLAGAMGLLFTLGFIDSRVIGPALLIALGAFLLWRRAR